MSFFIPTTIPARQNSMSRGSNCLKKVKMMNISRNVIDMKEPMDMSIFSTAASFMLYFSLLPMVSGNGLSVK